MKYLMLFADEFEDVEAFATYDVLKRGKIIVDALSVMPTNNVNSKCGYHLTMDKNINDVNYKDYDGIIIPGGPASFKILNHLEIVDEMIHYFAKENKLVAAICAAPHLVGRLGYLKNRNYTVHPGFEDQIIGGTYLKDNGVVISDNFITAKSMYYSIDFGLAIFNYTHSKEETEILLNSLKGNK